MNTGLLWYDNSATSLASKLQRAVERYRARFHTDPNTVYLHEDADPYAIQPPATCAGLTVRTSTRILRHHLWLGVEEPEFVTRGAHFERCE